MSYFLPYLRICLKRVLKNCASVVLVTIVLIASMVLAVGMLIKMDKSSESRQRVKVGLVGDTSQSYLGFGFYALKNIDESSLSIDFTEMSEEEARNQLKDRKISAYAIIPDDFVNSLINMKNKPIRLVMSKTAASVGSLIMGEVAGSVSGYITQSESGIYAMLDYFGDHPLQVNINKEMKDLNMRYIGLIVGRPEAVDVTSAGVTGIVSTMDEYYVCGILTLFLLMFGVSCSMFLSDKRTAITKLLRSRGMQAPWIISCEYFSYFVLFAVVIISTAIAAGVCTLFFGLQGSVLYGFDVGVCVSAAFRLLPCIAMLAAMQFFFYEVTDGIVSGVFLQFIAAVGMGYISGCFYPYYFFPEAVQKAAAVLPSGIAFRYVCSCFSGYETGAFLPACGAYILIFIALSVLVRIYRYKRS